MSTIYTVSLFLIVLTGIVSSSPLVRVVRSRPGCGPVGVNIDKLLQKVNAGQLIPCCDQHDACYGTCGTKRSTCDTNFLNCLNGACSAQKPTPPDCLLITAGLYSAVHGGGELFYKGAQFSKRCPYNPNDD